MRELIERLKSRVKYAATATVAWKNKGWNASTQLPYREVVASSKKDAEKKVAEIYKKLIRADKSIPSSGYKLHLSVEELELAEGIDSEFIVKYDDMKYRPSRKVREKIQDEPILSDCDSGQGKGSRKGDGVLDSIYVVLVCELKFAGDNNEY
jgi:hypothetical protein